MGRIAAGDGGWMIEWVKCSHSIQEKRKNTLLHEWEVVRRLEIRRRGRHMDQMMRLFHEECSQ